MRILLDAKDLIELVEHDQPITLSQFSKYLHKHKAYLVLSFANVSEFVAPLARGADFLTMRGHLQRLEGLPVHYIREPPIPIEEIRAALSAFESDTPIKQVNPYVRRWDETFNYPGTSAAEIFVNFRLDDIVFTLWRSRPDIFVRPRQEVARLRRMFEDDRKLPDKIRKDLRRAFCNTIENHLRTWSAPQPGVGFSAFCKWVYSDPTRCPGLRLNHRTFHEMLSNLKDTPRHSDIPDFGYIYAVPYVDICTLDRRVLHYCKEASKKLRKVSRAIDYAERIFPNLEAIVAHTP
jgi:hypothetical protein